MHLQLATIPNVTQLAYMMALVDAEKADQQKLLEYRNYYDGDQDVKLTDRQREFLNTSADDEFRLNQCQTVVESLAERLGVIGFEPVAVDKVESDGGEIDTTRPGIVDFANQLWESNRMDGAESEIYRQAAIDHVSYIVLDIDSATGEITFNHNDAYVSPEAGGDGEGVKLHYADKKRRGKPLFATKRWAITNGTEAGAKRFFVVYYPDRIERYYQDDRDTNNSGEFSEIGWREDVAEDGPMAGVWPQPWVDSAGQPLGLPVIEFKNGRQSELSEVVPVQRALNKSVVDLIAAADVAGFGILFAAGWIPTSDGLQISTDDDGTVSSGNEPLQMEPGALFYTSNERGSLTRINGDDLDRLIRTVDKWIISIAQVSRTPITNFQMFGQVPAEGTQRQLESGLLAKAAQRQLTYGNAWEDLIYLARRVALGAPQYSGGQVAGYGLPAYSAFDLGELVRISTLWKEAATRSEKEHLETLEIKRSMGVPQQQIFIEMGYTAQQAEAFSAEMESQRVAGLAATLEAAPAVGDALEDDK